MFNAVFVSLITGMMLFLLTGCNSGENQANTLSPELEQGKQLVEVNCLACHAQGINGAPIIGNQKMWGKRTGQGKAVLVEHAINGYELMPAKGGNPDLSDQQIALAVGYMLSQLNK